MKAEMSDLIRTHDWAGTPLGPRDRWPGSLRMAVDLIVASHFPKALLWSQDLILLYNDAYRIIAADKHPRALGRSTREVWAEVWHINEPIFAAVMERGETLDFEDKLFPIFRDGRKEDAYFTLSYSPVRVEDGSIGGTLVVLQETTERKIAQDRLQRIVEKFDEAQRIARIGSWDWDLVTDTVWWSDETYRIFGVKPGEYVPNAEANARFFHPDDLEPFGKQVGHSLATGDPLACDLRLVLKDGRLKHCLAKAEVIRDASGSKRRLAGVIMDITERKRLDDVLRFLAQSATASSDGLFFRNLAEFLGKTLDAHYICIDRLSVDSLTAKTVAVYHDGRFEDNVEYALKDTPCGDVVERSVCMFPRGVCALFPKDDVLRQIQAESYAGTILHDANGRKIGLIAVISRKPMAAPWFVEAVIKVVATRAAAEMERTTIEERLRQSEKMTAIGQLAGGMAHDYNNQLAAILAFTEHLQTMLPPEGKGVEIITDIKEIVKKAAERTKSLLAFARKGKYRLENVDMHDLVMEVVRVLQHSIEKRIAISVDLTARERNVEGDPSQLFNALLNLALNARDAIFGKGTIAFRSADATIDAAQGCRHHPSLSPGRYIVLTVTDTGCGMTEETMRHLFEPFFTTKAIGKGSGLGLAGAWGTAVNHKGTITVESRLDQGSSFAIFLPVVVIEETCQPAAPTSANGTKKRGTVLLVDDEESMIRSLGYSLEDQGFTVTPFTRGDLAVEHYRKN